MRSLKLPSPALVLAFLALFAAFTGGAIAAGKLTGKQIKDGTVTGKDIKNESLTGSDIRGQVKGDTGARGATGPAGPRGAAGSSGPVTYRSATVPASPGIGTVAASCPDGQVPTGGGVFPLSSDVTVNYERPVALLAGDEIPDSWEAFVSNSGDEEVAVSVTVICVAATGVVDNPNP
jgi:hypothetical protein